VIQIFVTGTDTGVGKTTVACALVAAARARGLRVLAIKPIETGCALAPDGRSLQPADALALERASRHPNASIDRRMADRPLEPTPLSTVYRFAAPLAPSVAAELAGAAVALAPILRAVDRLRSLAPDLLLVEGAGGLLVPLSETADMADLAAALDVPLLVVARDSLGTINHTLLTLEAAAARGLPVAGVVLCAVAPGTSDRDAARNAEEIARRGRVPILGRLGHLPDLDPSTLVERAEAELHLDPLLAPARH
jgi:dethiobiotin synthetase